MEKVAPSEATFSVFVKLYARPELNHKDRFGRG